LGLGWIFGVETRFCLLDKGEKQCQNPPKRGRNVKFLVIWSDFLSADREKTGQERSKARESRTVSGTFRKKSADIFTFFEKSGEIWKKTGSCQEDNMRSWAENAGSQENYGDLSRRECGFLR
jgi:hypothetical protein